MGKTRRKLLKKTAFALEKVLPAEKQAMMSLIMPVPDMMKTERVLFVGPHPDDIEVGAGATLARMAAEGKKIRMVICTDGGSGTVDPNLSPEKLTEIRFEESKNSAALLGITDIVNLGFPDGGVYSENDMAEKIAWQIYDFEADMVICPDPLMPSETHPDHLACGKAARAALTISSFYHAGKRHGMDYDPKRLKPGKVLAYYYTHRPNSFVETSKEHEILRDKMIEAHVSQFKPIERDGICMYLSLRSKDMGKKCGVPMADGFFAMAPMHQHCVTELDEYDQISVSLLPKG